MKELKTEFAVEDLLENWQLMQEKTIEILSSLDDDHLVNEIYQTPRHHPFVKTKQDSLSWNIKHTMWHCGQIGMLRRVIDKSFDFGM